MALGNVHLTPQLVQAVRDAVDIVDVAGDHTRLTKAGHRWQGLCPLHKEKTPSFSVDPTQGLYYCFGCGRGGDAIGLYMELSGDDFPAAIESLARRYGVPLPARPSGSNRADGRRKTQDLTPVLEAAARFFREQLAAHAAPRRYLADREVPDELVESYEIGYAPDGWQNLTDALRVDFGTERLEAAGLIARSPKSGRHYDRFRHRLIFPIKNPSGRIVGFGGRTLGDDKAKYVNTSETDEFHKGSLLYGLDVAKKAIRDAGKALLVEGYFDVVGAVASGVPWAVAGMGTALTGPQAKLLSRFAEEVVIGYDGDDAGEKAFRRTLPTLLGEGLTVRRARFGEGEDPDSLRLAAGAEAVRRAIDEAPDAVELELDRLAPPGGLRDPREQAKAASEVVALLSPVPDAILRFAYARRAAERLEVPVEMLSRQLDREGGQSAGAGATARGGRGGPVAPSGDRRVPGGNAPGGRGVTSMPTGKDSTEEDLLTRLLDPGGDPPAVERLPPDEVFFDPVNRNIYRALHALYRRDGRVPDARELVDALAGDADSITRLARYQNAPEYPANCRRLGFGESVELLMQRWRKERRKQLQREIGEADRRGDDELRNRLIEEKLELDHAHYRGVALGKES